MAKRRSAPPPAKRDNGTKEALSREPRRVLIVAVPPVRALDVIGPAEVLSDANSMHGGAPAYSVEIVSASDQRTLASHAHAPMLTDRTFREFRGSSDTVLVAGGDGARNARHPPAFLDWLRKQCGAARRYGSICTGAFVLAEAGLLNGRRATTHWHWCQELARDYPRVKVDADPIFIKDGKCYTSAGITAGIDLTLAFVEEDLGSSIALQVAQWMVVFLRRPGGQNQFSATLAAQTTGSRTLSDLLVWIADNIRRDLTVDALARRVAMSPRNFARLFVQQIHKTPGRHMEDLRLEAARRQLESTQKSLEQIAEASGFKSAEVLRRVFARRLGTTPGMYRKTFGRAAASGVAATRRSETS